MGFTQYQPKGSSLNETEQRVLMKTITGTFEQADGTPVTGTLRLALSSCATIISNSQPAPNLVEITLNTDGTVPSTQVWANDELTPATTYCVTVESDEGLVYGQEYFSLAGTSPISLTAITPSLIPFEGEVATLRQ